MADIDLQVRVNKRIRLTFTSGEDRTVELLFQDGNTQLPLDLTGARLTLALPKAGGFSIKRRTAGLQFSWSQVVNLGGMAVFNLPSHGYVTGDTVQLATVNTGDTLPAPFLPQTPYLVVCVSANEISLLTSGTNVGSALALAAPATGSAAIVSDDFAITTPTLGVATCILTAACTNACAVGQGQDYQIVYTAADNLTRIFSGNAMLDVFGQPDYLELGDASSPSA